MGKVKKIPKAVLQPDTVGYFKTTARIISIAKFARCVRDRNDSKQLGLAHAPQAADVSVFLGWKYWKLLELVCFFTQTS